MEKRVFLIVLDSCGCGEMPDSADFGDAGSNTLRACTTSSKLNIPMLTKMGIFNIDEVGCGTPVAAPVGAYGRMAEKSRGKDTTIGHWELAGVISPQPMPTFPDGFPESFIKAFEEKTGRKVLCNKPYSGTEVIKDYGREQKETGGLICYTSADSVFQIAANEADVPVEELYHICEEAREMLQGPELGVGRVIARPYVGEYPNYTRTSNRHDFSLKPPKKTLLDYIQAAGLASIGVGKIYDIFAGQGITVMVRNKSNTDGMNHTLDYAAKDFNGLCFVNLVDFDMLYGHRNDVDGYANALTEFDVQLRELLPLLQEVKAKYPGKTIWCFAGFRLDDELLTDGSYPRCEATDEMLACIDVLVDGRFMKELKDISLQFRGSRNQRVIDMNRTRETGTICIWDKLRR